MKIKFCFCIFVLMCFVLMLSSCYSIDSTDISDYESFIDTITQEKKAIANILPSLDMEMEIKEANITYSNKDLIDTIYLIYIVGEFSSIDQYNLEIERLNSLCDDDIVSDYTNRFDKDVIVISYSLDKYSSNLGYFNCTYAFPDDEAQTIVYVTALTKDISQLSNKIPREYLPAEVHDW